MNNRSDILVVLISAVIFAAVFFKQATGLNLLIYEVAVFAYLIYAEKFTFRTNLAGTTGIAVIATLLATVLVHSTLSYFVHVISLFLFVGVMIYPEIKSLLNALGLAIVNAINSQAVFLKGLSTFRIKGRNLGLSIKRLGIFIIPLLIIILFIFMYSKSNPVFNETMAKVNTLIWEVWEFILNLLNFNLIFVFIIGIVIGTFMIIHSKEQGIIENDLRSFYTMVRMRKKNRSPHLITGLTNEYKAGVFLLFTLNFLLLILNIADIKLVWIGFDWDGQYLKQFVHEGTYLLICSILISIGLVLYYFRDNLNFYKKNDLLKVLSYIWLAQNFILTLSVAMRNIHYISHFALAYKRIGVFIFLLMTLYGLYSVFIKVQQKKTTFYLFSRNAYFAFVIVVVASLFNWDRIIANYNFSHSNRSFVHFDFLATLSDASLPILDKSLEELQQIERIQEEKFPFDEEYMSAMTYHHFIATRKQTFIQNWEEKNWLSWNWPEYTAYQKIKAGR